MKLILSKPVQGQTVVMAHFFQCYFQDIPDIVSKEWDEKWNEINAVLYKRYDRLSPDSDNFSVIGEVEQTSCVVCKIHANTCTRVDTSYCATIPLADGFSVCSPIEDHYRKAKGRKEAFARATKMFTREERRTLWEAYLKADPKALAEAA